MCLNKLKFMQQAFDLSPLVAVYRHIFTASIVAMFIVMSPAPGTTESVTLKSIDTSTLPSPYILFDSNRSGTFGIYMLDLRDPDRRITKLIDTDAEEMYPVASQNKRYIVYAKHENQRRNAPSDIWIFDRISRKERRLISNGTFPRIGSDGNSIIFERNRKKIMHYHMITGKEKELLPGNKKRLRHAELVKPQISPNGRFLAFITNKPAAWHIWTLDLFDNSLSRIVRACEPAWFPDSNSFAYVQTHDSGTRIKQHFLQKPQDDKSLVSSATPLQRYFPQFSHTGEHLLYSSSSSDAQSHTSAPYDIMLYSLVTKRSVALTQDTFTNRWASFLPELDVKK